jgi:FkbM family methyltransferase
MKALLDKLAASQPNLFFVQIGSNDGCFGDPLYPYIKRLRWAGVLVEPLPHVYRELCVTYSENAGLLFENAAIAEQSGVRPFYYLQDTTDPMPPWYRQLGSFNRHNVIKHRDVIPNIENYLECISVPCITFEELARKHRIGTLHLLHIDTESYDYQILRTIDFSKYRPALVIYEHRHLASAENGACAAMLTNLGYQLREDGDDTWAADPARF